jgi:GDP-L-fucose synthase
MITPVSRIYVAGHSGMVGSAIVRGLQQQGFSNILCRTHDQLDLSCQQAVHDFFTQEHIDYVVLAAAKVGGIQANYTYPADFITTNLQIECNVITEAFNTGITDLLFLGSSCIYPRNCPQPIKEDALLTGSLEPTNEPYAIAKIAGITLCRAHNRQHNTSYLSVMPTNLYGEHDNFHLENSHVIPALIRKYHLAKMAAQGDIAAIQRDAQLFGTIPDTIADSIGLSPDRTELIAGKIPQVVLWGTGRPCREFLHVDDMAGACIHLMKTVTPEQVQKFPVINVGAGQDQTITATAEKIAQLIDFKGKTIFDNSFPDGTPKKLLDTSRIRNLGWKPAITLKQGLQKTYQWYVQQLTD